MSFWTTSDNQAIEKTTTATTNVEIAPIPAKTVLKAMVSEAKWDEYQGDRYISLTWTVVDGEYKKRLIFQKIRVNDKDPKKADRQKRLFAAIATNAGGELFNVQGEPSDYDLARCLSNKIMCIRVQVWKMEDTQGNVKSGNWIDAVASKDGFEETPAPTPNAEPDNSLGF